VNQELENYLRFYITYLQNDWVLYLPMAEFVRNNSIHSSIGTTPFYANKGFNPTFDINIPQEISTSPAASREVSMMSCKVISMKSGANKRRVLLFSRIGLPTSDIVPYRQRQNVSGA